jgi:ring-1,2-phenylacetyl-CoA epoxidase subunit PaaD
MVMHVLDKPVTEAIWEVLRTIPDPEIPVISICDLGIVRAVNVGDDAGTEIVITPTYSGCPAMQVIEDDIHEKLGKAGFNNVRVRTVLQPAWTTDWLSEAGSAKLQSYGVAPPGPRSGDTAVVRFVHRRHHAPSCPQCGSHETERLAEFGSTTCKALYRCLDCREPFDYFKAI